MIKIRPAGRPGVILGGRPDFMMHYSARYGTKHAGVHQVLRSEVEKGVQ
jgi:hypothetical protein